MGLRGTPPAGTRSNFGPGNEDREVPRRGQITTAILRKMDEVPKRERTANLILAPLDAYEYRSDGVEKREKINWK